MLGESYESEMSGTFKVPKQKGKARSKKFFSENSNNIKNKSNQNSSTSILNLTPIIPIRNSSIIGADVYSHSGEYSPRVNDFIIHGRGLSFSLTRKYRSSFHNVDGLFGFGWMFKYSQHLERATEGIIYCDGVGRKHLFKNQQGGFVSPNGLYCILEKDKSQFILLQRYGKKFYFEELEKGGRLYAIRDRNGNTLKFEYNDQVILITESMGRRINLILDRGHIVEALDHNKRQWKYNYDDNGCLIEVIYPKSESNLRPIVRYSYDRERRLISITNPNGKCYLENDYDIKGRIVCQRHGQGKYLFKYHMGENENNNKPIFKTEFTRKNGSLLILDHDNQGLVIKHTLLINSELLSEQDREQRGETSIVVTSIFNQNGELVKRTFPVGNAIERKFNDKAIDPRDRGNLLEGILYPCKAAEEAEQISTKFDYEPYFQLRSSITNALGRKIQFQYDNYGNLIGKEYPPVTIQKIEVNKSKGKIDYRVLKEHFEYNSYGQIVKAFNAQGIATEYHYYSALDPHGITDNKNASCDSKSGGGYLARIVKGVKPTNDLNTDLMSTELKTEFTYDINGNPKIIRDGKGQQTSYELDELNRLVHVVSRKGYERCFRYDACGNLVETEIEFDRSHHFSQKNDIKQVSTKIKVLIEYNELNKPIKRIFISGESEISEIFKRDESEKIICKIQPEGNVTEYKFDERGLLVERKLGLGTSDASTIRYTYTLNGRRRSKTDGKGNKTIYEYDAYHRYAGFVNPIGIRKKLLRNALGRITRLKIINDTRKVKSEKTNCIAERVYLYDELNRLTELKRSWRGIHGEPIGQSKWDFADGWITTAVQYNDNHRPAAVWFEDGRKLHIKYDSADRVIEAVDASGISTKIKYDNNSNRIRIDRIGLRINNKSKRFHHTIVQKFDEEDRLISRRKKGQNPQLFKYNSIGLIMTKNKYGRKTYFLQDEFGRTICRMTEINYPIDNPHIIINRIKLDRNGRITARINSKGETTRFLYDSLNRRKTVIYPDGATKHLKKDMCGNTIYIIDQNRNEIKQDYDSMNRMICRTILQVNNKENLVEKYQYDELNRLVKANKDERIYKWKYDSLSRIIEKQQDQHLISYKYDSAGNRILIKYPSGCEIRKEYDVLRRITKVWDGNKLLATYNYDSNGRKINCQLGENIRVLYDYQRNTALLSDLKYEHIESGLLEGYHYMYSPIGRRIAEICLHKGMSGEQYDYDNAGRLISARYGVENPENKNSPFKREVLYNLTSTGTWSKRLVYDGNGKLLQKEEGEINQRQAYTRFGHHIFGYDANGNQTCETSDDKILDCQKTYDYANRLVIVQCKNQSDAITKTITYQYDPYGRQVLRIAEAQREKKEIERVWSGSHLIEEYENGSLARSYVHGAHTGEIVLMRDVLNGDRELFYTYNGRGMVTGLIEKTGAFAERWDHDVFGIPSLTELNGIVGDGGATSSVSNPLIIGKGLWDSQIGRSFELGGVHNLSTNEIENPESRLGDPGFNNDYSSSSRRIQGRGGRGGLMANESDTGTDTQRLGRGIGGLGLVSALTGQLIQLAPKIAPGALGDSAGGFALVGNVLTAAGAALGVAGFIILTPSELGGEPNTTTEVLDFSGEEGEDMTADIYGQGDENSDSGGGEVMDFSDEEGEDMTDYIFGGGNDGGESDGSDGGEGSGEVMDFSDEEGEDMTDYIFGGNNDGSDTGGGNTDGGDAGGDDTGGGDSGGSDTGGVDDDGENDAQSMCGSCAGDDGTGGGGPSGHGGSNILGGRGGSGGDPPLEGSSGSTRTSGLVTKLLIPSKRSKGDVDPMPEANMGAMGTNKISSAYYDSNLGDPPKEEYGFNPSSFSGPGGSFPPGGGNTGDIDPKPL